MLAWNSTCFGQFLCPSSGVYSLYTQQCYMSYRFVDIFWAGPRWNLSGQWINSWWWTEELPEICRFSCQNKFVKLVHLNGFTVRTLNQFHSLTPSPQKGKSPSTYNFIVIKFHCFTVHFVSLSFIYTNVYTCF